MDYRNSDMSLIIDEYIHNARYRDLLRLRLCEGLTYEEIAEAATLSNVAVLTAAARKRTWNA